MNYNSYCFSLSVYSNIKVASTDGHRPSLAAGHG